MTDYSHSRLSSFEECPRKFKYRYVDELKVDTEGVEAFMGKRVHEILERLYHHVARFGKPPSLSQVLDRFRMDWTRAWHERVMIVRVENPPEYYQDRGARCLENFYRAKYPFDDGETLGLEHHVRLQLDDEGRYHARGIVDRVARRRDGVVEIHDYKTSGFLPHQRRIDEDRQLALYQIGLAQTYPDAREFELVWHYLVFNKTLRSNRTQEALDKLRSETVALIDSIEAETEYKPRPGPLCRWCDYADVCPEAPEEARAVARSRPPVIPEVAPVPATGVQLTLLLD